MTYIYESFRIIIISLLLLLLNVIKLNLNFKKIIIFLGVVPYHTVSLIIRKK